MVFQYESEHHLRYHCCSDLKPNIQLLAHGCPDSVHHGLYRAGLNSDLRLTLACRGDDPVASFPLFSLILLSFRHLLFMRCNGFGILLFELLFVMEENEECVICHQFNDQMLMLQCVHDPCINCAAAHYAQEFKGKLKNYYYTCQLCGERTQLDISSVIELQKLAPKRQEPVSMKKPSLYRNNPVQSTTSLNRNSKYDINVRESLKDDVRVAREVNKDVYKDSYKDIPRDNPRDNLRDNYRDNYGEDSYQDSRNVYSKKSTKVCKDHPDEEVSYYCFKCYQNICPQCAIHGAHQGHDVKGIKKAVVDVRKQFSQIIESIVRNQEDLRKNRDHYSRKIKQLNQQTQKQKSFVSKEFETLRNTLMIKQREYLKQLDEINHRNASILTTQIDLINKQTDETQKLTRSIEQTLKRDEVSILEEFGRKNQSYSNEVQKMSVSQAGYSNVPGLKAANLSQLKHMISAVANQVHDHGIRTEEITYSG